MVQDHQVESDTDILITEVICHHLYPRYPILIKIKESSKITESRAKKTKRCSI